VIVYIVGLCSCVWLLWLGCAFVLFVCPVVCLNGCVCVCVCVCAGVCVCVPKETCPSLPGYATKSTRNNNDKTHSCHNVGNKEPANAIAHAVNKTILAAS
jgi:hypothetical protein